MICCRICEIFASILTRNFPLFDCAEIRPDAQSLIAIIHGTSGSAFCPPNVPRCCLVLGVLVLVWGVSATLDLHAKYNTNLSRRMAVKPPKNRIKLEAKKTYQYLSSHWSGPQPVALQSFSICKISSSDNAIAVSVVYLYLLMSIYITDCVSFTTCSTIDVRSGETSWGELAITFAGH